MSDENGIYRTAQRASRSTLFDLAAKLAAMAALGMITLAWNQIDNKINDQAERLDDIQVRMATFAERISVNETLLQVMGERGEARDRRDNALDDRMRDVERNRGRP